MAYSMPKICHIIADSNSVLRVQVMFLAHIYKIDLLSKTAVISWLIMGCGAGFMLPDDLCWPACSYYNSKYCGQLAIPIDIFIDGFVTSFLLPSLDLLSHYYDSSMNANASYSPRYHPTVKDSNTNHYKIM